jgi:hypothetical protein
MVLPMLKQIHYEQCLEQDAELRIQGGATKKLKVPRAKLNIEEAAQIVRMISVSHVDRSFEKVSSLEVMKQIQSSS